ncbi:MAG TPA: glycosyltransferase family 87 protein [Candidatus Limnocylindrales bacterium]
MRELQARALELLGQLDQVVFRDRLSLAGIAVLAWFATFGGSWVAYDAYAYWSVDPRAPYHFDFNPDQYGAFRYSPAVAQLFSLFHLLPWPAFAIGWFVFLALVVAWLGRRWSLALLVFVPIVWDGYLGNIEILLAAAMVIGFRKPAAWSFVLLTKVTPGIGLLWFVARREWRNLAIALGATAVIVGISFAIAPGLWLEWPRSILAVQGRPSPVTTVARVLAAALLVIWGARTNRPWTVIVAGTLALAWLDLKTAALLVGLAPFLPALPGHEGVPAVLPGASPPKRGVPATVRARP